MLNRRQFVAGGLAAAGLAPGLSLASLETDKRLLVVLLRGAVDGLALLPPHGEPRYAGLRGPLEIASPGLEGGVTRLDGLFGLHPAFDWLAASFDKGEALAVHAVASPYRERSHFDGQDALENGTPTALGRKDGWLNRAIRPLGGSFGEEPAIALGGAVPMILRGDQSVASWAPSRLPGADDDLLRRLARLYEDDEFLHARLAQAMETQAIAESAGSMDVSRRRGGSAQFRQTMRQAATFLKTDDGPSIAVVDVGGWDTHANQGASGGQLANRFSGLDAGLAAFRDSIGDLWNDTAVLVMTEFGRTVKVNGTQGTDHGTGTAALLVGGGVKGGRVISDWPGLAKKSLYQERDLYPTTDLRSLCKSVLIEHLGLDEAFIEREVFPESGSARPLDGLFV